MGNGESGPNWSADRVAAELSEAASAPALASRMRRVGVEALMLCAPDGRIARHRTERSLALENREGRSVLPEPRKPTEAPLPGKIAAQDTGTISKNVSADAASV